MRGLGLGSSSLDDVDELMIDNLKIREVKLRHVMLLLLELAKPVEQVFTCRRVMQSSRDQSNSRASKGAPTAWGGQ